MLSLLALVIRDGVSVGRRKLLSCPCCVSLSHNASELKLKRKGKELTRIFDQCACVATDVLELMMKH